MTQTANTTTSKPQHDASFSTHGLALGPDERLLVEKLVSASLQSSPGVVFSQEATRRMQASAEALAHLVQDGREIYGLTTGFGPFVDCKAATDPHRQGVGLINHLASGYGKNASHEIVRTAMIIRAQTIAQGHSGINPVVAQAFADMVNAGVVPAVPELGSVGASGDLIPLAHCVQTLTGNGYAIDEVGERIPAAQALMAANLLPTEISARDALSLVNGTAFMSAFAVHAIHRAQRLMERATEYAAWCYRLLSARAESVDPRLHKVRGHAHQTAIAEQLTQLLAEPKPHVTDETRPLQEVYSIRCTPQWLGAGVAQLDYAAGLIETEINGVTDNPVVLPSYHQGQPHDILHGGNFQGTQIAFAGDAISAALTHTGLLVERQIDVLSNPQFNNNAPLLLAQNPGADAGIAGVQITATALLGELRHHSMPAALSSYPTNGRNQDVVSMGTMSARNAYEQTDRLAGMLACASIAAAQLSHRRAKGEAEGPVVDAPQWASGYEPFDSDRPTREAIEQLKTQILS